MNIRQSVQFLGVVLLTASAGLIGAALPSAVAQPAPPCPDVEVVFARGTAEPPGVGGTGQAFVDAVRAQAGGKSVEAYAVDYPASSDFMDRIAFARTVVDGIRDAGTRIEYMAETCPETRMVLGGFSQGAAVAGYTTSAAIPDGIPDEYLSYIPNPMPPSAADHVAAVVLLGKPSNQFLSQYGAPLVTIGPLYAPKTLELCAPGDTICDGASGGIPTMAHALYPVNGMVNDAAAFAASRL